SSKRTALSSDVLNNESSSAQIDEPIPQAVTASAGEGNSSSVGNTTDSSGDMHGSSRITGVASAPSKPDTAQPHVLTDSNPDLDMPRSAESDLTTRVDDGHLPSQTGEIYTGEVPASPESILSEPQPTSDRSVSKPAPITPVEAVEIIYKFSKYQDGPPRQVHARILQSLQGDSPEA
ncbi:hypothetical protein KXX35_003941, partial [Aspergillus fumigatus]